MFITWVYRSSARLAFEYQCSFYVDAGLQGALYLVFTLIKSLSDLFIRSSENRLWVLRNTSTGLQLPKKTSKNRQNAFPLELPNHEIPFQLKVSRYFPCKFSRPKQNKLVFLSCKLNLYICIFIDYNIYFSSVFN